MSLDLSLVFFLVLPHSGHRGVRRDFSSSIVPERSGPVTGALVATLPISAGPSYVFLAIDHDAAFIAQGALSNASPSTPRRSFSG